MAFSYSSLILTMNIPRPPDMTSSDAVLDGLDSFTTSSAPPFRSFSNQIGSPEVMEHLVVCGD